MANNLPPVLINPNVGDAICDLLERLTGVEMDIILVAVPKGDWSMPQFITSADPDVMEAAIVQYGEKMMGGSGGKRAIINDKGEIRHG